MSAEVQVQTGEGWVRREGQPRLYRRVWRAEPCRGVIVRLHGIESHAGWYEESSMALARGGFTVHFVDRRGAGRSEGERGDIDSWKTWIADIRAAINDARWLEGVETVHLLANCWGARPALACAAMHPRGLSSVITVAPALILHTYFGKAEQLGIARDQIFDPTRRRHHPVWDARLFTRDTARVAAIEADPLALHECTARFFVQTRVLQGKLKRLLPRLILPTLALFGGEDQVIDLPHTQEMMRRIPGALLTMKTYPGQWHMLEFEPERDRVCRDILRWLGDLQSPP
ncbi:alpha/beta fold hydrolase [Candidatus Sumerlaeota bacterium]|nr:alpha/beta fold hydrolase [Candidatus Sumerlaeota bacterium]